MKRIVKPFVILISAIVLMSSCLGDDDGYNDFILYSDTAITSFSLGTLNRTMWTTSSTGEDSSYVDEIGCSSYKFYIDQLKREIYNPDSLPVHTDVAHTLCEIESKNSGIVILVHKDIEGKDSLVYFNSSDSIDFTEPREFRVYSLDGAAYRSYKVSVNVHKENPDSMNWHRFAAQDAFTSMDYMKAVALGGNLLVFGEQDGATSVYSGTDASGMVWTKLDTGMALDAGACRNVIVKDGTIYSISGGNIISSADGKSWTVVAPAGVSRLLGTGRGKFYAMDVNGGIVSSADGASWTADAVVGDRAYLPSADFSLVSMPMGTSASSENIVLAGNRGLSEHPEDSVAMVWNKIEEYAENSHTHSWIFCGEDNGCRLPRLSGLKMASYGDVLIAFGGRGLGTSTAKAYSQIYVSSDNGLTWHSDGSYYLPEGFTNGGSDVTAMTVDDDNHLWIICGGTGDVWRGRLNRLGWDEEQTSFTE